MTDVINSVYFNHCVAIINFRLIPKSLSILYQNIKMNGLFSLCILSNIYCSFSFHI